MTINEQFEQAQQELSRLTKRPSNEEFLELYALYKQATEGDNDQKKPSRFDLKKYYKWNSWIEKKGLSTGEAMEKYIAHVELLMGKYPH